MAFYAQGKSFQALQQDKSVEGTDGGTCVAQQNSTDTDGIGSRTGCIDEAYAMIAWIRFGQLWEFAGSYPVEFS